MKEQVIQFIMSVHQWCGHSETCGILFRMWGWSVALVVFWGVIELVSLIFGKVFGDNAPPPPPVSKPAKRIATPSKPKKASVKKKSVKKKSKK